MSPHKFSYWFGRIVSPVIVIHGILLAHVTWHIYALAGMNELVVVGVVFAPFEIIGGIFCCYLFYIRHPQAPAY